MGLLSFLISLFSSSPPLRAAENAPEKIVLPNGLPVIYLKDDSSPLTVLKVLIDGGKEAQPPGLEGLAFLVGRLALEIPDEDKVQSMMSQASRTGLIVREDFVLISLHCLSDNFEETVKIVSGIMRDPLFSGIRMDRIKSFMRHLGEREQDESVNVGHLKNLAAIFGPSGYGSSVFGDEKSLKAIKKKDITDFHGKYFTAGRMALAVSSDLDKTRILEVLQKYFLKIPTEKRAEAGAQVVRERPPAGAEKEIFAEKDTKQTMVSVCFPLPQVSAENFLLASLVENLLGKGIGSRLWPLRAKEKLAYSVNAQALLMKKGGLLEAYLETDAKKRESAREALRKTVSSLYEQGITEDELAMTKANAKGDFLRENETKESRIGNMIAFEGLGLGYDFLNRFIDDLDAVRLDQVNAFIKEYLKPEKAILVFVGKKN